MDLKGENMSAPGKSNIGKLDNPARVTANHRHGTEPCEAMVRAVCQPQRLPVRVRTQTGK